MLLGVIVSLNDPAGRARLEPMHGELDEAGAP
jgi:hypothetical protein